MDISFLQKKVTKLLKKSQRLKIPIPDTSVFDDVFYLLDIHEIDTIE